MADKNIGELASQSLPLASGDKTLVSRDGVILNQTTLADVKSFVLDTDAVTTSAIDDEAVTSDKLATDAVTTPKIDDLAVTADKLATDSVTTAKILNSNVTTSKIADANVTTAKIADSNITTAKIADSNVTTVKVGNNQITYAKVQQVTGGKVLGKFAGVDGNVEELPISIETNGDVTLTNDLNVPQINSAPLADTSGSVYHGVIQIQSRTIATQSSQVITNAGDTLIGSGTDFEFVFTPRRSNSWIKLTYRWFGEATTIWSISFNVHKNGTRLNTVNTNVRHGLSMATQTYGGGADNNSTPEILNLVTIDKGTVVAGQAITYRLVASTSDSSNTLWTNRCFGGADTSSFETGISEIIIEEYAR
jgi:hypothetical protein